MAVPQGTVHLIVNPVAGHGKALAFVNETIIPTFKHFSISHQVHTTTSPGDAGNIGQSILSDKAEGSNKIVVAIIGGDGTLHEFVDGVNDKEDVNWEIVLLPFGTANALFSSLFPPSTTPSQSFKSIISSLPNPIDSETQYQLSSLFTYLSKSIPISLPITQTTIQSSTTEDEKILSHVVLSTSLHASILQDSEDLRKIHPGTERFKIAAQQNASKLFNANVKLYPSSEEKGEVKQWDSRKGEWVKPFTINSTSNSLSANDDKLVQINGPFSYFLSTSTVDRLEPTFVISPLSSLKSTENDRNYIYIIIIRPLRDPLIKNSKVEERKDKMVTRAFEVVGNAYSNGNHINLTFPLDSTSGESENKLENKGDGEPVVEVFRCSSFDWIPAPSEEKTYEGLELGNESLLCADGALHTIPKGGIARIKLEEKKEGRGFYVFA